MKAGWPQKKLGEICRFVRGPFGGSLKKSVFVQDGFAVYEQQHAIYNQFESIRYFIDGAKFQEMRRFELHPNDVIMSCSGTMGKVAIVPDKIRRGIINQALLKLTPLSAILPKFLKYWMDSTSFQDSLKEQAGGAAIQNVASVGILKEIKILLPPLPEQQRIVGILDEAFEGIATAKANAEKNLQNARALFESHLQFVFTQRGEGWVEKPLEKVAFIINGFAFKSTDFSPRGIVKSIKITNVGVREFVCESDCYLPEGFDTKYVAVSVQKGSIVIALTRTIISGGLKVAVVPDEYNGALLNQRVAAIISSPDNLTVPFLFAYLSTQTVVDYVKERVNTLMQPNLSINDLRSMPIPLPTIQEQNNIANKFDELREETKRLESIYRQKLAALDDLKKSLLHKAFTGQLTKDSWQLKIESGRLIIDN